VATTNASFRLEVRDLLADTGATEMFGNPMLDRWRDAEIRGLMKYHIAKEVTNYTGVTGSMLATTTSQTDFAMPLNWVRVTKIEFWTDVSSTEYVTDSASWDDRVRSGFVTIYDAPLYFNSRIKLMGLEPWTKIDDAAMPQEVVDVVLYGTVLRAITNLTNRRAASRRAAAATRNSDSNLGAIAFWRRQFKDDYRDAVRRARRALRPIGV